jgi:hypothetical protein
MVEMQMLVHQVVEAEEPLGKQEMEQLVAMGVPPMVVLEVREMQVLVVLVEQREQVVQMVVLVE